MSRIKTFYDELGVDRDANAAAIKRAFKEIAKVYHPDKNPPEKQAWAHEHMSRLNFILETLLSSSTRKEYDELVKKYEEMPLTVPLKRSPREQNALEMEYAQVSVQIMNLSGKYSNCRLKMMIGGIVGGSAASAQLVSWFGPLGDVLAKSPMTSAFIYFFTMVGGVMIIMGGSDYLGRGQYRRRVDELEQRRSHLRERMYEVYASN